LLFTNKGNYLFCPVHQLPDIRWKDVGQHIANIIPIDRDEQIIKAIPINDFSTPSYLFFITKNGMVKKTELLSYKAQRHSKPLVAIHLKGDDELVDVHVTDVSGDLLVVSHFGLALWFDVEEVGPIGVRAAGVKGISLKEGDYVIGGQLLDDQQNEAILIVTQRGAVKKIKPTEFEKTSRAKRGVVVLRELKSNPHRVIGFELIKPADSIFIESEKGNIETFHSNTLKFNDRYATGSFLIDESETGKVKEVWKVSVDEEKNIKTES
jgi:topoisomerase-4 subunit A